MPNAYQLEFVAVNRGRKRPFGPGREIKGDWIYEIHSQSADLAAYSVGCTNGHIYHLIEQGAFPNTKDVSSDSASKPSYRITRQDILNYLEAAKIRTYQRQGDRHAK